VANRGDLEPLPDEKGIQITLHDGQVDEWDPKHPGALYKVAFGTYTMTLTAPDEDVTRLAKKLKEMTFSELWRERRLLDAQGIDTRPISLEWHRRVASSFATVVFVLFGLSVGLGSTHHERLIIFIWILALFIGYYLAAVGTTAIAMKGWLPPWLAMWIPNFLGGAFGAFRTWRAVRS